MLSLFGNFRSWKRFECCCENLITSENANLPLTADQFNIKSLSHQQKNYEEPQMQISVVITLKGTRYYEAPTLYKANRLSSGLQVNLKREPNNPHDDNAVAVALSSSNQMLGHLPRELAPKYSKLITNGRLVTSVISEVTLDEGYLQIKVRIGYMQSEKEVSDRLHSRLWRSLKTLENNGGVYTIRAIGNGQQYIGSSKTIRDRLGSHLRELEIGVHDNSPLQIAYNENGPDGFEAKVITVVQKQDYLLIIEAEIISTLLRSGVRLFNLTADGQGISPAYKKPNKFSDSPKSISERENIFHDELIFTRNSSPNIANQNGNFTDSSKEVNLVGIRIAGMLFNTIEEASQEFGVSQQTIKNWIHWLGDSNVDAVVLVKEIEDRRYKYSRGLIGTEEEEDEKKKLVKIELKNRSRLKKIKLKNKLKAIEIIDRQRLISENKKNKRIETKARRQLLNEAKIQREKFLIANKNERIQIVIKKRLKIEKAEYINQFVRGIGALVSGETISGIRKGEFQTEINVKKDISEELAAIAIVKTNFLLDHLENWETFDYKKKNQLFKSVGEFSKKVFSNGHIFVQERDLLNRHAYGADYLLCPSCASPIKRSTTVKSRRCEVCEKENTFLVNIVYRY